MEHQYVHTTEKGLQVTLPPSLQKRLLPIDATEAELKAVTEKEVFKAAHYIQTSINHHATFSEMLELTREFFEGGKVPPDTMVFSEELLSVLWKPVQQHLEKARAAQEQRRAEAGEIAYQKQLPMLGRVERRRKKRLEEEQQREEARRKQEAEERARAQQLKPVKLTEKQQRAADHAERQRQRKEAKRMEWLRLHPEQRE
jgi:hypothetical protein